MKIPDCWFGGTAKSHAFSSSGYGVGIKATVSASRFGRTRRKISAASGVVARQPSAASTIAQESREPSAIAQLFSDLMQSGFFQRDRNGAFRFLAFGQRAFGRAKITAQQKQNRPLFFDCVLGCAMDRSARAGGKCVKIYRRMRLSRPGPAGSSKYCSRSRPPGLRTLSRKSVASFDAIYSSPDCPGDGVAAFKSAP